MEKYLNFRWIWVVKRSSFFITLSVDVFMTVYSRNVITRISFILSHSRNCLYRVIPLNVPRQTSVIFYNPIGQFINYACAHVNGTRTDVGVKTTLINFQPWEMRGNDERLDFVWKFMPHNYWGHFRFFDDSWKCRAKVVSFPSSKTISTLWVIAIMDF